MATARETLLKKIHKLSGSLKEISAEMNEDPMNVPSIEVDRMLKQTIELYDNLKRFENINLQPWDESNTPRQESGGADQLKNQSQSKNSSPKDAPHQESQKSNAEPNAKDKPPINSPEPPEQHEVNPAESPENNKVDTPREEKSRETFSENVTPPGHTTSENIPEEPVEEKPEPKQQDEPVDPPQKEPVEPQPEQPAENETVEKQSEKQQNSPQSQQEGSNSSSGGTGQQSKASLNDRLNNPQKHNKELGERFKNKPISNLKSAISINQKMGFIRELFQGDERSYKKAIDFMNKCGNYAEAKFYLEDELKPHYNWDGEDPMFQELLQLVYRRFL